MKKLYLIIVIYAFCTFNAIAQKDEAPNILCILVDDLGYGDLSVQGATDLQTPAIDNIAKQGMTFSQFYANCPVCSPSRASLLTGKFPDLVGVPGVIRQTEDNTWGYLKEGAILIPEILNKQGYHTALIGKWHLGLQKPNRPTDKGFDLFRGFLGDMMDDYYTHRRGGINWMRYNEEEVDPKGHATDIFTDWAIEYLNDRKNKQQPFFLYLAYNAPHFPIQPPEDYLQKVLDREKGINEKRAKNVAFIEHLDDNVSRVMKTLEETGLIENTLVVFTSDNGGSIPHAQSNGELRGGKQQMFEGGIRVPAFAMWKNKIQPGSTTNNLVMLMDLFPTFCQIAEADFSHFINGISILPTLMGEEQVTDQRYVFWVRREGGRYNGKAYHAGRYGDYKVLQNSPFEPYKFFNLKEDMYEKNPLQINDNEQFSKIRYQLQLHIQNAGSIPWQAQDDDKVNSK